MVGKCFLLMGEFGYLVDRQPHWKKAGLRIEGEPFSVKATPRLAATPCGSGCAPVPVTRAQDEPYYPDTLRLRKERPVLLPCLTPVFGEIGCSFSMVGTPSD